MWTQLPKVFTRGLGSFVGFLRVLRKSAATRVEALEEDEKEEGDEPTEEVRERRHVWERAAQERSACVSERGGRGLERGERQRKQQVEAVEHEQRGGEARVHHGDVERRARLVFAKSRTDLHKCQASPRICRVSKNAKRICKTVGEIFL